MHNDVSTMTKAVLLGGATALILCATSARAEPVSCQKQLLNQLLKFKKVYLKSFGKCLDKDNFLKIPGPCPDEKTSLKVSTVLGKVKAKIALRCSAADLLALGYGTTCDFDPGPMGVKAACSALPATTPEELVDCLVCWKRAEASELLAILYASHANEICDDSLDETSPTCTPLACTDPLPDQRDLGSAAEGVCQKMIGKMGIKHAFKRLKILEKCGRAGGTQADCLADVGISDKLASLGEKLSTKITNKCGNNTTPKANTPFCCRTGVGNMCTAAADRDDCLDGGGTIQEGKFCDVDETCSNPPGPGKDFTWWETCPSSPTCPGTTLATLDDLIACVESESETITDTMLCHQFPADWPCPGGSPSGAFL